MEEINMKILDKIESIEKYLPKPIKHMLRPVYAKITKRGELKIDKELLRDIVEFHNETNKFKITYEEGVMLCKLGKKLMADLWNIMGPKTGDEIKKYYEIVPYSLFELVYAHGTPWYRKVVINEILEYSSGEALDYGGGVGQLSLMLVKKGLNVTYVDVQSINMKFAKWLFKKYGCYIKVLDAEKDQQVIWRNSYDTILCIAAIEHILDPKDVLDSLRNNGRLIITNLENAEPTAEFPFHLKIPFDAKKLLNSYGIFNIDNHVWIKSSNKELSPKYK